MAWLLLIAAVVGFAEVLARLPVRRRFRAWLQVMNKAGSVFASKSVSDHWKERALLAYAGQTLSHSLALLAFILLACLPVALAVVCAGFLDLPLLPLLVSPGGIAAGTLAAAGYLWVRRYVCG